MFPWALACVALHLVCRSSADFLETALEQDPAALMRQHSFLDQVEEVLGPTERRAVERRLVELALALTPSFTAMPKNEHGGLSASSARYSLHRLLIQRHRWQIKGLAPDGKQISESTPALGLGGIFPERLGVLLDDLLGINGFDFHEIVLIAATVEMLVHANFVGSLERVYSKLGLDTQHFLNESEATLLIEFYMDMHIAGLGPLDVDLEDLLFMHNGIDLSYPSWSRVAELIASVRQAHVRNTTGFSFSDISTVLETMSEQFGGDCRELENQLLRIEDGNGTGRVKLREFYRDHMNGTWQFQERIEYLRVLGVLDESDPSEVHILIPNYLHMPANCLNVSLAYDFCCIDSCGDLLSHVEIEIRAPHALPSEIISALSETPSAHVPAHRKWSPVLLRKLEEVAAHHEGMVPLHGRLFAQWMHFAYPRECMYPHLSDTTSYWTDDRWLAETGLQHFLSHDDMTAFIEDAPPLTDGGQKACDEEEELCHGHMWLLEEELVDPANGQLTVRSLAEEPERTPSSHSQLRLPCILLALLAASAATIHGLLGQVAPALQIKGPGQKPLPNRAVSSSVYV